jgi:arylsulfatase A-like enzyme
VPLVVKWPSKIASGTKSDHVSAFWDWLPTLSSIVGIDAPDDLDGISFLPTLMGDSTQKAHDFLYWEFHELGGRQAVLRDGWKLVKLHVKDESKTKYLLFDLNTDQGETKDLADDFPAKVEELKVLIEKSHLPNPVFRLFTSH